MSFGFSSYTSTGTLRISSADRLPRTLEVVTVIPTTKLIFVPFSGKDNATNWSAYCTLSAPGFFYPYSSPLTIVTTDSGAYINCSVGVNGIAGVAVIHFIGY